MLFSHTHDEGIFNIMFSKNPNLFFYTLRPINIRIYFFLISLLLFSIGNFGTAFKCTLNCSMWIILSYIVYEINYSIFFYKT